MTVVERNTRYGRGKCLAACAAIALWLPSAAGVLADPGPAPGTRIAVGGREGAGPDTLPDGPVVIVERDQRLRITPLKGLERPWALAFLPNGAMLVTERPGRLRRINPDFTLDPTPIAGLPQVLPSAYKGLMDVALHPRFPENHWVYFTYSKPLPGESDADWDRLTGPAATVAVARGRYDGASVLTGVEDVFVADAATSGVSAARLVFAADGTFFLSIGAPSYTTAEGGTNRVGSARQAQDPASHAGKVLRLNDDGSVPADNPFLDRPGYRPEIFALGIRNTTGMVVHPTSGELWAVDHGPSGGDELNIIRRGRNYGWPVVSFGRAYSGERTGAGSGPQLATPCAEGMELPLLHWNPNIAPGGLAIYGGSRFTGWRGDAFIGGLRGTQLHRVALTPAGQPTEQEALLLGLGQRIREVREGPDGLLYLLTDHDAGALLRVAPADD